MSEIRQLRYFLVLAETLHFGRAARQLNIVQPALSMQIKALEETLGVSLFKRSPHEVRLTIVGELFRTRAQALMA
ncbi:LysR family transcriptional regulator [Breoghania sp.]|uniref:LysR family transcriptional regulator n=1 Tax=Breoghania sp. TaxID=2065378 RepID=UPI002608753B|nr:LysR family transcriptional regulator [Breoghania sp.]MDJ0929821.1 LysR family transcriptional regulator [Breoghania sp.]